MLETPQTFWMRVAIGIALNEKEKHVRVIEFYSVLLAETVKTAMRMLDKEAVASNLRHRPVGLGVMGLQDVLYARDIPFDSDACAQFSDELTEFVSYHAILASSEFARERGRYESYLGLLLPLTSLPPTTWQ